MTRPTIARPRRVSPVLICKKCLKRCSNGGKIRRELKRELKLRRTARNKAPRLVSTDCFSLCPKRAVVLASGPSLRNGEYMLVSHREEIGEALDMLLPSNGAAE